MACLVLINGAPGSGKSTLARGVSQSIPMALALDIDQIKHSLGQWEHDMQVSGLHARRLALAVIEVHLRSGYDVVVGQYLARTEFIEALQECARHCAASFHEFVLDIDAVQLAQRLRARSESPSRPEHAINNELVRPADAPRLVESLAGLRRTRPNAVWIDNSASADDTLTVILAALACQGPPR